MGAPLFLLQIVENQTGRRVAQVPGGGPLEADIIETCVFHVLSRNVGLFTTRAQVETAVRDGIKDAMLALKDQTRFIV